MNEPQRKIRILTRESKVWTKGAANVELILNCPSCDEDMKMEEDKNIKVYICWECEITFDNKDGWIGVEKKEVYKILNDIMK